MCLTKIYATVKCANRDIKDILSYAHDDPNKAVRNLRSYENNVIDNIVCSLMYYDNKKGPKFIDAVIKKVHEAANARFLGVMIEQSCGTVFTIDDINDLNASFELRVDDTLKSFVSIPPFADEVTKFTIKCITGEGCRTANMVNTDNITRILYNKLQELQTSIDFESEIRKNIIASANVTDMAKVIDAVETSVRMAATPLTYITIASAIENSSLYKVDAIS